MYAGDVLSIYIITYNTRFVFQTKKLETALAPLTTKLFPAAPRGSNAGGMLFDVDDAWDCNCDKSN